MYREPTLKPPANPANAPGEARQETRPLTVSVIIPVYNGEATLRQCLEAVNASDYPHYEVIVVNDGSKDGSADIAEELGATVVPLPRGPFGPGLARNQGSEIATGDILLFVDADVVIRADSVRRIVETFVAEPKAAAVFGSYDAAPSAQDFASQYRNLLHHFVHQQGSESAETFWAGCGAVRRDVFREIGGFDGLRYPKPSIEDIELGGRIRLAGHKIVLNSNIQVKHLKRWTLRGIIKTDVFSRAVPWTRLIKQSSNMPNRLNLAVTQRISGLIVVLILVHLGLISFFHNISTLPLLMILFVSVIGYWSLDKDGPLFSRMSLRAEIVAYALIVTLAALIFFSTYWRVFIPLTLMTCGTLGGRFLPQTSGLARKFILASLVLGLISGLAILMASFSIWLLAPLLTLIGLVLALNYKLYVFFARQRGITFAAAVFPFHMLYYLYSVFSYGFATGAHALANGRRT